MPEVSLRGWGVAWRVGKRKRERNSSGLVLWPMFHHSQYFISVFEKKNREVTSNNSADDTNRRNAYDSKTKSKIYISRFDFQAHTM